MNLTAEQIRDMNWDAMQGHLHGYRAAALAAWRQHGPGTSREVASRAGWDLLSLRPRTTELLQLGFLAIDGRRGGEGVYHARTDDEVRAHMEGEAAAHRRPMEQPELKGMA